MARERERPQEAATHGHLGRRSNPGDADFSCPNAAVAFSTNTYLGRLSDLEVTNLLVQYDRQVCQAEGNEQSVVICRHQHFLDVVSLVRV